MKTIKQQLFPVLMACMLGLISTSCEQGGGGGDDPGMEPAEISGDSGLLIINHSGDESTVYFDSIYIGNVEGHGSRQWDVPSGNHALRIDNAEQDNSEDIRERYDFPQNLILFLDIDWKADSIF